MKHDAAFRRANTKKILRCTEIRFVRKLTPAEMHLLFGGYCFIKS